MIGPDSRSVGRGGFPSIGGVVVVVVVVAAVTALGFPFAEDSRTGRAEPLDGLWLALTFLGLGLFTDGLPSLWKASRGSRFESAIMPGYMFLALLYVYTALQAGIIQPGATAMAVSSHIFVLVCLSFRDA